MFSYRPQLDGLRALAVAAVAWSHWERPYQFGIPFGSGVHLFYVLSGFLITGILLELRGQVDRMAAVRAFYVRRALRIFPAFYVTLTLAWLAKVPPVRETIGWHLAYLSNVQIFVTGEWPGAVSHLWSLAVEEQFYLLWPWLIVFAPARWLLPALIIATASSPLFRWWLASEGYRETLLGVLTPGSMDSLGVGALLAVGSAGLKPGPATESGPATNFSIDSSKVAGPGFSGAILLTSAAWAALLMAEQLGSLPLPLLALKQTLQAVFFGWLVVRAAAGFQGAFGRLLSAAPVVYIGRISYGVYLVHGFVGALLGGIGLSSHSLPEPWRFLLLSGVTIGVAMVSWHLVEQPLNALKRHFPYDAVSRSAVPVLGRSVLQ